MLNVTISLAYQLEGITAFTDQPGELVAPREFIGRSIPDQDYLSLLKRAVNKGNVIQLDLNLQLIDPCHGASRAQPV